MFNGQVTTFIGFADGASRYTLNISLASWVLYSPTGDLVSSWGTCLGPSTNNITEYHAVIGLLTKSLANDVREIRVYLDSELVVHQLNQFYTIHNPILLHTFRRVRILERYFEQVSYQHIQRQLNVVANSLENFILDWYLSHN